MHNSISDRIPASDAEIEARFALLGITGLAIGHGDEDSFTITADTLDDFLVARERWAEPGRRIDGTPAGSLLIRRAQAVRSQERRDVAVVDFGDVRVVCRI